MARDLWFLITTGLIVLVVVLVIALLLSAPAHPGEIFGYMPLPPPAPPSELVRGGHSPVSTTKAPSVRAAPSVQ